MKLGSAIPILTRSPRHPAEANGLHSMGLKAASTARYGLPRPPDGAETGPSGVRSHAAWPALAPLRGAILEVADDRLQPGADLIALGWSRDLTPDWAAVVREVRTASEVPVRLLPGAAPDRPRPPRWIPSQPCRPCSADDQHRQMAIVGHPGRHPPQPLGPPAAWPPLTRAPRPRPGWPAARRPRSPAARPDRPGTPGTTTTPAAPPAPLRPPPTLASAAWWCWWRPASGKGWPTA
jgi:hypothetical protein